MNIISVNLNLGSMTYGNNPKEIILHHAEASSCTVQDINIWHKNNGWAGIGYHYFIRKNGEVYKGRPDNAVGAHCQGSNSNTIGICFEGSYNKETMPTKQLNAGKELISYLKVKYGITKVSKHKDHMATDCPGANFPFSEMVNGTQVSNDATKKINISTHLRDFQKAYNDTYGMSILIDGLDGSQTQGAVSNTIIRKGQNNALCGWIQCRVGATVDNIFGSATEQKVKEFQRSNSLVVDGIVGPNTIKKLLEKYNW